MHFLLATVSIRYQLGGKTAYAFDFGIQRFDARPQGFLFLNLAAYQSDRRMHLSPGLQARVINLETVENILHRLAQINQGLGR